MEVSMGVGERIKLIRIEKKMSQSEIAGNVFSRNYLSQIERELIKPSQKAISHCAKMLNIPEFLLVNEGTELNSTIYKELTNIFLDMRRVFSEQDYLKCIDLFKEIEVYGLLIKSLDIMKMTLWAIKSYFALQDYDNSLKLIRSIKASASFENRREMEMELQFDLCESDIYFNQGEFDKALNGKLEIEKKLDEYNLDMDIDLRIDNLSWIQVLYEFIGKKEEVKKYYGMIQELTKKNKVITRGLLRSMTGYYHDDIDASFHEKLEQYEMLNSMSRLIDDWDRIAVICCYKIELLFDYKHYDSIEKNLDELNSIILKLKDPMLSDYYKAYVSLFRSKLMTVYWNYDQAKKLLNTAIEFLEKNKAILAIRLTIDCHFQSAIMYNMIKQYDSALLYLDMAETASKKYKLLNRLSKIKKLRMRIFEVLNNENHL